MIFLAFDTETTGIDAPRLVELGAVLVEVTPDGPREHGLISFIVRPDGYEIPDSATRVHGISTALALAAGVPLVVAISALTNLWAVAAVRVAHNLEFDDKVIDLAMRSLGRQSSLIRPPGVCTKELAGPVLNLPPTERMLTAGYNKPKPPSLRECYRHFFGEDVPGAHGALADARACARVYLELMEGEGQCQPGSA